MTTSFVLFLTVTNQMFFKASFLPLLVRQSGSSVEFEKDDISIMDHVVFTLLAVFSCCLRK